MSARCEECGKYRSGADLAMVYTGGPAPEPDHYACAFGCRAELVSHVVTDASDDPEHADDCPCGCHASHVSGREDER